MPGQPLLLSPFEIMYGWPFVLQTPEDNSPSPGDYFPALAHINPSFSTSCFICLSLAKTLIIATPTSTNWINNLTFTYTRPQHTLYNISLFNMETTTCVTNTSQTTTSTTPTPYYCAQPIKLPPPLACPPLGSFLLCGTSAYTCVPQDLPHTLCLYVFLTPNLSIRTEGELESSLGLFRPRHKRAVLVPLLVGTGVLTAVGTGVGGISLSVHFYHNC